MKKSTIRFKSHSDVSKKRKQALLFTLAALLCICLGFFTGMLFLPTVTEDIVDSSENTESQPQSSYDVVSSQIVSEPEKEENKAIKAVYLPVSVFTDGDGINDVINMLKSTEINAVVVDIKDESGYLYYDSKIDIVQKTNNISEILPGYGSIINKLHDSGYYVIGRLVCFKDNFMPKNKVNYRSYSVLTDSNVNWYYNYIFWMDPYKEAANNYLLSIIEESCNLGFDEIMLDEVKFPDAGPTEMLVYNDNGISKVQRLTDFINSAANKAHSHNVKLSLKLPAKIIINGTGSNESGQQFDYSALNIDYFSPDLMISSLVKNNKKVTINNITVTSPLTDINALISAAKDSAYSIINNGKAVIRPFIQPDSAAGYNYSPEQIKKQTEYFSVDGSACFIYYNKQGSYDKSVLS